MTQQNRSSSSQQSDFKRTWSNVHLIQLDSDDPRASKAGTNMGVQIAQSNDRFPLYTWELVQLSQDGKRYSRMRVSFDGRRSGKITIPAVDQHIAALFQLASDWIHERMQDAEDKWIEFEQDRAKKNDDRAKPKQHAGLKQLAKQDAAKRANAQGQG